MTREEKFGINELKELPEEYEVVFLLAIKRNVKKKKRTIELYCRGNVELLRSLPGSELLTVANGIERFSQSLKKTVIALCLEEEIRRGNNGNGAQ